MNRPILAAVVQLCSKQNIQENLNLCCQLLRTARERGAELIVLPENFAYIGSIKEKLNLAEPLSDKNPGPILSIMLEQAQSNQIYLLLGGIPIRSSDDPHRFFNTAVLLSPTGTILASYQKIHLFDVQLPGSVEFKESAYVIPGKELVVVPVHDHVIGLSICYDLRFPELYRALSQQGATILTVPAAFTLHTGKDHWFPLLRARAIENQCYVLAAAQYGAHNDKRASYGKSCIIDPWGAVIAQVPDQQGIALAELDIEYLIQIRQNLPALTNRRLR